MTTKKTTIPEKPPILFDKNIYVIVAAILIFLIGTLSANLSGLFNAKCLMVVWGIPKAVFV